MSSVHPLESGSEQHTGEEIRAREEIIAEYRARLARGETPTPTEYAARFPELGDSLIDLLSAVEHLAHAGAALEGLHLDRSASENSPHSLPASIGPYPIRREIARGGMGVVYEAYDPALDRVVALKVLPLPGVSEAGIERFRREVQSAGQLEHPGIVRVYDSGISTEPPTAGLHYFVMQHIEGESLAEWIATQRSPHADASPTEPTSTATVVEWIAEAAEALHFAHSRGVVHRDIKPSNLLIDLDGRAFLADFGLAKQVEAEAVTASNDVVGTLRYLAPERLSGVSDPRSDIYSLGLVLYEALTLEPAIRSNDRAMLLEEVAHASPIAPRKLDPQIPRELETILLTAINPWPGHRYANAKAFAEDLRAFLADRPIRARRPGHLRRGLLWARRNRALAATMVTASTLLVAATITYLVHLDTLLTRTRSLALSAAAAEAIDRDPMLGLLLARESARLGVDATSLSTLESALAALHEVAFIAQHRNEILSAEVGGERGMSRSRDAIVLFRFPGEQIEVVRPPRSIVAATLDQDGSRLAFALEDGTVEVRDVSGPGRQRIALSAPPSQLALSATLEGVYCVVEKNTVVTIEGNSVSAPLLRTEGPIRHLALHPTGDGFLVAEGRGGVTRCATDGSVQWRSSGPVSHARFSPDGEFIAIARQGALLFLDRDGRIVWETLAHSDAINDLAFSQDGTQIATASADQTARTWGIDGAPLLELDGHSSGIEGVAFDRSGERIVTVSADQTAIVWNGEGEAIAHLRGHDDSLVHGAFSPDGEHVVTASADGTVRFWQVQPVDFSVLRGHEAGVYTATFSPDGTRILTASRDRTARLWDLAGNSLRTLDHPAYLCAAEYLPGREEFLVTTVRASTYRYALDGTPLGTIESPARRVLCGWDIGGEQRFLARGIGNEGLIIAADGTILTELIGHESYLWSASFDPRTGHLLTTADDGTARRWNATTGVCTAVYRGHASLVRWASASPTSDRVVTCADDGTARVWRTDGTPLAVLRGHEGPVLMASFSPEGERLLTASRDATARVWTLDGACVLELDGHDGALWSAAFSPDGSKIVTASFDRTARTWLADRAEIVEKADARATRGFTEREWREYGELLRQRFP